MISRLKNWIVRRIALGEFSKRRDVLRFATIRTVGTTIAAVLLNIGVSQILGRLGIFNITIPPDPVADTIVTAMVAGPISFLAYYVVGAAILDLAISRDEFERLSRTDALTGLLNRRAFMDCVEVLNRPYVLVLLDIDRFKSINDQYGHGAGDEVLVGLSRMFNTLDGAYAVARLGGEEFAAILTDTSRQDAIARIDALRERLAERVFQIGGADLRVTFSAGLAQSESMTGYSMLFSQADKAMYLAKAAGRNRVIHADDLAGLFPVQEPMPSRRAV